MDIQNALEAVEAIRGTVPEADQANFDMELATRLGLIGESAGTVAVGTELEIGMNELVNDDTYELISNQLGDSLKGYESTVAQINSNREDTDKVEVSDEETLANEFEAWLSEDRLKFVKEVMEADPELSFTLTAVPNVTVTVDEILDDARDFGKDQPYPTEVYPEVISQYTAEEVSGTNPENNNKFKFVLVPSKFTEGLYGRVNTQKEMLGELQKDAEFLEAPTPLVGMTYLRTRRAMGDKLVGPGTADKTYMRSYDMEPKSLGRRRCVPSLFVYAGGKLIVSYSSVVNGDDGFALVG